MREIGHSIQGVASNVGAPALAEMGEQLRGAASSEDLPTVIELETSLASETAWLEAELAR